MRASRRTFLKSVPVAGAGLLILCRASGTGAEEAPPVRGSAFRPNAFLQIAPDGAITFWVVRLEMGQGVRTLLPMMLAEELEVDLASVRIEQAEPGGRFADIQLHTSGSSSSSECYEMLRTAAAAAREMLVAAAAARWNVEAPSCRAHAGVVTHAPSGRELRYGVLAAAAAKLPVPGHPALKDRASFAVLGRPARRIDGSAIVTGRAQYGLDVRVPDMLVATILRAPTLGATVRRFDDREAMKLPGVRHVVPVSAGIHPGVAVLAEETWSALRGRDALKVEWSPGPQEGFDSERYLADLPNAWTRRLYAVRREGDADAALAAAARRHEATYIFPFQAHAPLETMNCTADIRADSADIWVPTQTDVRTIQQVSRVTGLARGKIRVHPMLMGGGFGRRLFADYAAEAAALSKSVGRPVQVMWTREDDMTRGYFQPATAERFTAGLDASGRVVALVHLTTASDLTIYDIHEGRNIWTGPPKAPKKPTEYAEGESPWGAFDNPYAFANLRVDCADVTSPVPVGPWRAVEYPSTVFGRESFLDELAHLTGVDPIAFRLKLLPAGITAAGRQKIDRARLARVLEAARDRVGRGTPLTSASGRRRGRGVAASVYHAGSYLAMIADVSAAADGSDLRVETITTVVDAGVALNPLGLRGQTESAIAWGLTAALLGKMNFSAGAAVQTSYADFEVLRLPQMPALDTVILDSGADPGGYGEHPVPLVAPAVANALFAATGRRVRSLPLTSSPGDRSPWATGHRAIAPP